MQRVQLNREIGFFDSRDKQRRLAFLASKFDELMNEALMLTELGDNHFKQYPSNLDGILHELNYHGVDVSDKAHCLVFLYNAASETGLLADGPEKILFIQYNYLKATLSPINAIEALQSQEHYQICYYSEEQMYALISVVARGVFQQDSQRLQAERLITQYFLRLILNDPNMLENYADFILKYVMQYTNYRIARMINNLLESRTIPRELFPGSRPDFSGNIMYGNIQILLDPFIRKLSPNAIVFAYIQYENECCSTAPFFLPGRIGGLEYLHSCINLFIERKNTLTAQTCDILLKIAQCPLRSAATQATKALAQCPREQPENSIKPSLDSNKMRRN